MALHYKIANHLLVIHTSQPEVIEKLLPSFQPFHHEPHDGLSMKLCDVWLNQPLTQHGDLMHTFSWEENACNIYRTSKGYFIKVTDLQRGMTEMMEIFDDWQTVHVSISPDRENCGDFLSYFLMLAYSFAASSHQTLMMHASVIEAEGKGMLFLGKSGTGKSTHSQLWMKHIPQATLLNDDNPIVRLLPDGEVRVFGSPWSGKTSCYRNDSVKVASFVRLKQASQNRLQQLSSGQAFAALFPSCSNMPWDERVHEDICNTVALVASRCKVAELICLPDKEAVDLSYTLL